MNTINLPSINTSEVKHSNTCSRILKSANIKYFCEQVCNIQICMNLDHLNKFLLIGISDKVMPNLNSTCPQQLAASTYSASVVEEVTFLETASTPMETLKPLLKDAEAKDVDVHLYRSTIGSLVYLITLRPNIMFDVCACTRFQVTPKGSHLHAVKRIFRYLKGQPKFSLWYHKDSPFDLEVYNYSDYADPSLDRKSTTGADDVIQVSVVGLTYYCTLDNGEMDITATINGKVKIVSEASIRRHLNNYEVTCEEEAKRRNTKALTKIFEEYCKLIPYAVSNKEDTAYLRQLNHKNTY
ncbi:hypothetical protein Tco_0799879 [Tanacetum coccineum]|uniref:Reverse transcriptase Ty1/copia-type domain-containing protein n=1 Tax=Tanacetum coccineum TaxID=301880 RepID=A0ABQ4ZU74_9ASTR